MKRNRFHLALCVIVIGATTLVAQDQSTVADTSSDTTEAQPVIAQVPKGPPLFGPEQQAFQEAMQPIHFAFDSSALDDPGAQQALQQDIDWLKAHPDVKVYVEGYADWRGGVIYNMPLTQDRAEAVKDAMVQAGIAPDRILANVGFGKITQLCDQQDESCYAQNRRVSFIYAPPGFEPANTEANGTSGK